MEELLKQYQGDFEKTVNQIENLNKQMKYIKDNLTKLSALANKQSGAIEALNKAMETPKKESDE